MNCTNKNASNAFYLIYSAVLFIAVGSIEAQAAEWMVDADINQVIGYDDNVFMTKQKQGSFEYILTPTLNFARKDRQWDIGGTASYGLQRYPQVEGLDYSPQTYTGFTEYRTKRSTWGLNSTYTETLNRNFAIEDTGDFGGTINRTNWSVAPSFSYLLGKQDTLSINGQYALTTFSGDDFSDNEGYTVNTAWSRQESNRLRYGVSAFYSYFTFSGGLMEGTSESYGLNTNASYRLSPTWDINGTLGGRLTDMRMSSFDDQSDITIGFLGDIGLTYSGKQWNSSLRLGRSLIPSGLGTLIEQTNFSLTSDYQFTKRWQAGFNASYIMSSAVDDNQNQGQNLANRNFLNFGPHLDWDITREWRAAMSYRYQQQDAIFRSDSNALMLTLTYNWSGIRISR